MRNVVILRQGRRLLRDIYITNGQLKYTRRIHLAAVCRNNHEATYREWFSPDTKTNRVGPDRVLPANSLTTTWPDGAVELRTNDHPSSNYPIKSVWTMLNLVAARCPDRIALAVKRDGKWVQWTYTQYVEDIRRVAKAFIELGLEPHHSVNILAFNAPEWHISNIASVVAGGLCAGIYTTNSPDAVRYVAQHSRANIIVVDDQTQLDKVEQFRDQLKHLKTVVQFSEEPTEPGVIGWQELLDIGDSVPDSVLQERLEKQAVNQPCVLVYTSGTTGNPKGVMISQDNITYLTRVVQDHYKWVIDSEVGVSYLPLSHIAAQIIDIYLCAFGGGTMYFADKDALQGSLIKTLVECKPTKFIGVPRVWEKIEEKMKEIGKNNTGVKKMIVDWAKNASLRHHTDRMAGKPGNQLSYRIAKRLLLSRIQAALGLDRCCIEHESGGLYSSAAPLSPQTFQYFLSLDMPVLELLGSSETGGPQTSCLPGPGMRQGSIGRVFPHFETVILNPDSTGVGEIATRGRNVCLGYLWDEEKTRELIDSEGWVHSGDLGRMDDDGFFYINGRMKEIIITGGGENIAPVPIEDNLKAEMGDIVSHVMLIGDQRKHLAAIISLRTVLDEKMQPTEELHPDVQQWLAQFGSQARSAKELIREDNEDVRAAVVEMIKASNKHAISNAQKVHKFMFAPREFSLAGGELTPTMKIKRHFVVEKYAKEIEDMYQYETMSSMW